MSTSTRPGRWSGRVFLRFAPAFVIALVGAGVRGQGGFELRTGRELGSVLPGIALHGLSFLIDVPANDLWARYGSMDRNSLPAFDRCAAYGYSLSAHRTSNVVLGFGMAASLAASFIHIPPGDQAVPFVLVGESVLITSGLTDVVKNMVHRPRPYVYNPDVPLDRRMDESAFVSFWSGHTANMAAVSFTCASILQRSDVSRTTRTIGWIGAAALPAIVGVLRVKAGRHFPTDVITGYAAGAVIGIAVPYFHRAQEPSTH